MGEGGGIFGCPADPGKDIRSPRRRPGYTDSAAGLKPLPTAETSRAIRARKGRTAESPPQPVLPMGSCGQSRAAGRGPRAGWGDGGPTAAPQQCGDSASRPGSPDSEKHNLNCRWPLLATQVDSGSQSCPQARGPLPAARQAPQALLGRPAHGPLVPRPKLFQRLQPTRRGR